MGNIAAKPMLFECIHSVYNTSSGKTFCPDTANEYHIWFNRLPISPESHIIVISSNSSLQSEGIW
jgi:hypothetical protein